MWFQFLVVTTIACGLGWIADKLFGLTLATMLLIPFAGARVLYRSMGH
jgi:hypothetical protein